MIDAGHGRCAHCGGAMVAEKRRRYSLIDLLGVGVVGAIVFSFIGWLVYFSWPGKGANFFLLVAGFVGFGLYHMIGYREVTLCKCSQCGRST
jgi:hypothetical protein